nr:redoxin domain-containing protein [Saprospiraceae bacterium]
MEKLLFLLSCNLLLFISPVMGSMGNSSNTAPPIGEVKVVNFDELEPLLCPNPEDNEVYIVNFFATWCKPCVEELPHFLELHRKYKDEGLHFVLVSLDFLRQLDSRLIPFIGEHQVEAEVFLLNDPYANEWIPKVSGDWTGAIPATLVCNGDKSEFFEKTFHSIGELEDIIKPFLKD